MARVPQARRVTAMGPIFLTGFAVSVLAALFLGRMIALADRRERKAHAKKHKEERRKWTELL